jgi:hypothetical protein
MLRDMWLEYNLATATSLRVPPPDGWEAALKHYYYLLQGSGQL